MYIFKYSYRHCAWCKPIQRRYYIIIILATAQQELSMNIKRLCCHRLSVFRPGPTVASAFKVLQETAIESFNDQEDLEKWTCAFVSLVNMCICKLSQRCGAIFSSVVKRRGINFILVVGSVVLITQRYESMEITTRDYSLRDLMSLSSPNQLTAGTNNLKYLVSLSPCT